MGNNTNFNNFLHFSQNDELLKENYDSFAFATHDAFENSCHYCSDKKITGFALVFN